MRIENRTKLERRFNAVMNEQQSWIAGLRDIKKYILPTRGSFYDSIPNYGKEISYKEQLDATPRRAARTLASGISSGLTSASRPWLKLGLQNSELMELPDVKEWLEDALDKVMGIFAKSNIYGVMNASYEELGGFGTACGYIEEDFETVARGRNFTAGEYAFGQDKSGRINTFARQYSMTVGQLVEEFGIDNVSGQVAQMYKTGSIDAWIKVRHLVEPNDDRIPNRKDFKNKPFRSIQWEMGGEADTALKVSGYDEFPFYCPRWQTVNTSSVYGYGPGHESIGDVKMLMKLHLDRLIALDKVIDPPIQKGNAVQGQANTMPGGVTTTSITSPDSGVRAAYQINPDLNAIDNAIARVSQSIEKTFFADLFLMLANVEVGKATAYEISKRYQEKIEILGPVLSNITSEMLDPIVTRVFNIALRSGVIPIPPESIQGEEIKIEYISTLAQMQKSSGTTQIEQVIGFAGNLMQAFPSVADVIDADDAVMEYAELAGASPCIIRTKDEVSAIRAQKQQQMQSEQMAEALPQTVESAKTLSDTKVGNSNALEALLGVQAGQQK